MTSKRIVSLDFIRSIAILSVVFRHVSEILYYGPLIAGTSQLSAQSQIAGVFFLTLGRLGVPLFLMLSGYLLLDRDYSDESCSNFWTKRWLPLLLCTECWVLIYHAFLLCSGNEQFQLDALVYDILFFEPLVRIGSFWYMPMVLGLYLFLPIIARGLNRLEPKALHIPIGISFFLFFVTPLLAVIMKVLGLLEIDNTISAGFSGGVYGLYFIFGWLLKKRALANIKTPVLLVGFLVCLVLCVALQQWSSLNGFRYDLWYDNCLICLAALFLFELVTRIKHVPASRMVQSLSIYSFGIYLVHYPIKILLDPVIRQVATIVTMPFACIIFTIVILLVSWAIVFAIGKIPKVGKPLLFLKK